MMEGATLLENINVMSNEINNIKNTCSYFRTLLDEGTYKLDSALNIISNIKTKEAEIVNSGGDEVVLQQMSEEQIDNLLEMLKSPAFQKIARQLLVKWIDTAER